MIRLFDFVNGKEMPAYIDGTFVALGSYDLLYTINDNWNDEEAVEVVSDPYGYMIKKGRILCKGEHAFTVGFKDNDDEDKEFWSNELPYLFITSIQMKMHTDIKGIISRMDTNQGIGFKRIAYSTLDGGDVLICLMTKLYSTGYNRIMEYDQIISERNPKKGILRGSTTVMLNPRIDERIDHETIDVLLRCKIIDRNKYKYFKPYLEKNILNTFFVRC